jgi:hypothetical protein
VSSKAAYGIIPHDHWHQPDTIDEAKANISRVEMAADGVVYADSVSFVYILFSLLGADHSRFRYRNMGRFNSGVGLIVPHQALAD